MLSTKLGSRVTWRVVPLHTPRVIRRCSRCDTTRNFACTEKFRVNAQKRLLDVWLIYGCASCGQTWNAGIIERRAPKSICADLLQRFTSNDRELAWSYAFDLELLRRLDVRIDADVAFRVERSGVADDAEIECVHGVAVRLERVLAEAVGISRSEVRRRVDRGTLVVTPNRRGALRRPARTGQRIELGEAAAEAVGFGEARDGSARAPVECPSEPRYCAKALLEAEDLRAGDTSDGARAEVEPPGTGVAGGGERPVDQERLGLRVSMRGVGGEVKARADARVELHRAEPRDGHTVELGDAAPDRVPEAIT